MKIQHWAIIFIIIIIPFSIICRNTISKKNVLLRDETRINNIIDNATYDAVAQIVEVSEELGYGKNIPITQGVADAAIDRFFNTLSVNFNLPIGRKNAESYFSQYIPAIIIVGYDGLYVYSYESTASGYDFVLKPKIPYSHTYVDPIYNKEVTINFTLDNYVTLYFPDDTFFENVPDENGVINPDGTHVLSGYINNFLDFDKNGIDDLDDMLTVDGFVVSYDGVGDLYVDNDDPFLIDSTPGSKADKEKRIKNEVVMMTDDLSYILKKWSEQGSAVSPNTATGLKMFYTDNPMQDYEYDDEGNITVYASEFNELRRNTIINLITSVMKKEFNEHNDYTKVLGVTYNFNVPNIGRDQWNNTIDDISVLAFFQGMPMGYDSYYNNYSLGGARIVKANYLYAETVTDGIGVQHKVYHKYYCPLIPKDSNGNVKYGEAGTTFTNGTLPDGSPRKTTGIENIFVNADHAKEAGYSICSECM